MAASTTPHVLIVGAGTTGLLIAQGLKKYGLPFTIYEADSHDTYLNHQRDWSMALLWGAEYIKTTLPPHLLARFDEIKTDRFYAPEAGHEQTMPFYNGKTGELVVRIPGGLATRVSRVKLRKLFAEDLEIQFEKRVASIQEDGNSVSLTFTDGTTVSGGTVVFCDGVKSSAGRGLLLGEEQSQLEVCNCSIVNITHRYTAEQARYIRGSLNPVFKFATHPEDETLFLLTTTDVPDLDKPGEWNFQFIFTTWGATIADSPEERLRIFKEQASKYAEPWRSAVQWLPDDKVIPRDRIKYWKSPTPWPIINGKVTLAGDAAHPMVPFRAQGLNNAMRDSYGYVEALRKVVDGSTALDVAIQEYSDEVFARGSKEIAMSNGAGPLMHNWELLQQSPLMKWSYERPPATQATAADTIQTSTAAESTKVNSNTPEPVPTTASKGTPVAEKVVEPAIEPATEPAAAAPALVETIPLPATPAKQFTAAAATDSLATPDMVPDTESQAPSVVHSPEPAQLPFTMSLPNGKAAPVTNGVHLNGGRPSWENLYAENQRLRKLNEQLIGKLLDVSRVLGTGLSLDTARAIAAGDATAEF